MKFFSRVKNFLIIALEHVYAEFINYLQRQAYKKHFPSDRFISYDDALKNISMVLLNTHFSKGTVQSSVPAMVEVGGLQIKQHLTPCQRYDKKKIFQKATFHKKYLKDMQDWLDGSEHGAILFSFGTNAKSTFLPKEKVEMLLSVFRKMKQRIIMKWESDTLEGKPDNVMISKWLPQDSVLAHENTKLFISHCGLGSVVESRYHGVPIVGIPIFGDQEGNLNRVVNEGWRVKVHFATISEDLLRDAIYEVLKNPRYLTKIQNMSKLFKDRPMNARETAAYWVE